MQLDSDFKNNNNKSENETKDNIVKSVLNFAVSQNKILIGKYLTAK